MAISKELLSGSAGDGRATKVTATSSPGTTIHTAHATAKDEIWLWVYNSDSTDRLVTIEFGGTTSPDDTVKQTIAAQTGWASVVPGLVLSNSKVVRAYGATANVLTVVGYVNRIT